jgi:HEAT repeat protein
LFRRALRRSPDDAYAWMSMAGQHADKGEQEQAQACWMRALQSRGPAFFEAARSAALDEVTQRGDTETVWRALGVARADSYYIVRAKAVEHLIDRFGKDAARGAEVGRALESALADPVLSVRMVACKGIEELSVPARLPLLKRAVDNENWQVRADAVWVAGRCGATESLMARAAADEHADVRKAIARLLGSVPNAGATQLLLRALADRAPEVRGEAVSSLRGRAAEPAVRRALVGSLTDWHVSQAVLPILREQGWKPERERDVVHEQLARRDGKALRTDLRRSADVLMADIRYAGQGGLMQGLRQAFGIDPVPPEFRKYRTIENALYAFIGLGQAEHLPQLVATLNATDDRITAEAYLNCGHAQLAAAAREWARVRGFTIQTGLGAHPVSWGAL